MAHDHGILAFGAYIARTRLQRQGVAEANAWIAPGTGDLESLVRSLIDSLCESAANCGGHAGGTIPGGRHLAAPSLQLAEERDRVRAASRAHHHARKRERVDHRVVLGRAAAALAHLHFAVA